MDKLLIKIQEIVRKCGDILINAKEDEFTIEDKEGALNVVTKYDKILQEILKNELTKLIPQSVFIGEEEAEHTKILDDGYTFIVDPIDGTTNFSKEIATYTISVGLLKNAKPYIGVCYFPVADKMYYAKKGEGAYLNGKKIKVSEKKINKALAIIGGTPYYDNLKEKALNICHKIASKCADFRCFGSSVLEICYVAEGKCEVVFSLRLQPWDYAGAILILEEAGGKALTAEGCEISFDKPCSFFGWNNSDDYFDLIFNEGR